MSYACTVYYAVALCCCIGTCYSKSATEFHGTEPTTVSFLDFGFIPWSGISLAFDLVLIFREYRTRLNRKTQPPD